MTDPTTLSAAELQDISLRSTDGLFHIDISPRERDALVAAARRTEAAERENKSLKAALDSNSGELLPALAVAIHRAETAERKVAAAVALIDNDPTASKTDIRRALAED